MRAVPGTQPVDGFEHTLHTLGTFSEEGGGWIVDEKLRWLPHNAMKSLRTQYCQIPFSLHDMSLYNHFLRCVCLSSVGTYTDLGGWEENNLSHTGNTCP